LNCCCCNQALVSGLDPWHLLCPDCGYEHSTLEPRINLPSKLAPLNEEARRIGLDSIRHHNYSKIINKLKKLDKSNLFGSLLDVGAAHGWFIEMAGKTYNEVIGIEPDVLVASEARGRGSPVRIGYFPQALHLNEVFNVITFNDVFEHMHNLPVILDSIDRHLKIGGTLVLNLPVKNGIFYQIAKLLRHVGIKSPFERMWQKNMPSPHIHYFSDKNLDRLLAKHGYYRVVKFGVNSIRLKGLYKRIAFSMHENAISGFAIWTLIILIYPIIFVMPSDTQVFIYKRTSEV
jgi:SAM-dependent methyltransferase